MLLREIDTEFTKHKIFHYGAQGNKVVRHNYEMQHVAGVLYKGRTEPETEYTNGREMRCDLYVVFPETNTGLILEKDFRLCRKNDSKDDDDMKWYTQEYNSYLDSTRNTESMAKNLAENGFDSLEHYLERLRGLRDNGKWIGLLEIEFVRQVDETFADELAAYRLEYKARREERAAAKRKRRDEEDAAWVAERNAEAEAEVMQAIEILRNGGSLENNKLTFRKNRYDSTQYALVNYLLRKYGINVPLRTQGWIANSLTSCDIQNGRCKSCSYTRRKKTQRGSQAVFQYLNELIAAVKRDDWKEFFAEKNAEAG